MVEITKKVIRIPFKFFTKKYGVRESYGGCIKLPKFFAQKTVTLVIDGETYEKTVAASGTGSVILLPKECADKVCTVIFADGDVIDYFKVRYSEDVPDVGGIPLPEKVEDIRPDEKT